MKEKRTNISLSIREINIILNALAEKASNTNSLYNSIYNQVTKNLKNNENNTESFKNEG